MATRIYHNPGCSTSRNVLGIIRATDVEPEVILYLENPPKRAELEGLLEAMDMAPRDLMRRRGTPLAELGYDLPQLTDDALIQAMLDQPILIERPIVVTPKGTRLCRPIEKVLEILDPPLREPYRKENGDLVTPIA